MDVGWVDSSIACEAGFRNNLFPGKFVTPAPVLEWRNVTGTRSARPCGDASIETSVDRLRQDQGWLEENWREVLAQLQPVAEGFGGYDIDMLRHAADVYAALLVEHLALEQGLVFPAARASASTQLKATEMRRTVAAASQAG